MSRRLTVKFNGKIDRRSPRNEGDINSPVVRENLLSRNGRVSTIDGTELACDTIFSGVPTWVGRYYTVETGAVSPKTFVYTQDGKIWIINDVDRNAFVIKESLKLHAYPKHVLFNIENQTRMYFIDNQYMYRYDGNADNEFVKVDLLDSDENSVVPVDLIEHLDRLVVISNKYVFISKNLDPEVFDDATDSIQIIVGSGKGINLALKKIEDTLFILNTEGIFVLNGDVISAVAETFEVALVDARNIIAGRTAVNVEKAIIFLADDMELWSFDGSTSKMLSYSEKLKDFINPYRDMLNKAVATYYNNYYMLSFVEHGYGENNLEIFYDTFEDKIDFVRGRNVACYLDIDPTRELKYQQFGRSDAFKLMYSDRGYNFDGAGIHIRLRTRDITLDKQQNARILAFYPELESFGNKDLTISYHLDGRYSAPTSGTPTFTQNLRGETKTLGAIYIPTQSNFVDRVRPKINYSKGRSITFDIDTYLLDTKVTLQSIGIEYVGKEVKKTEKVGG